jgi:hypothetical protein
MQGAERIRKSEFIATKFNDTEAAFLDLMARTIALRYL